MKPPEKSNLMPANIPPAILACDTSCPHGSVGLLIGERFYGRQLAPATHAALLVHTMQELLTEAGISMRDVGTIITTLGPGSFTGIRISLAAMHGLSLASPARLKTCTSLMAVAYRHSLNHPNASSCDVWLHAGKGEAYTQIFSNHHPLPLPESEIILRPLADVLTSKIVSCGNVDGVHNAIIAPQAEDLCRIAGHLPETSIAQAMPVYVRAPDAKIPATLPWLASSA